MDAQGQLVQSDALGTSGSIEDGLAGIALNGLSRTVDGVLSRKYPLSSFNEPYAYEGGGQFEAGAPDGYLVPRSAPARGGVIQSASIPWLQNPLVWGGAAAVALIAVIIIASR